jgi:hypothetical protein
MINRINGVEVHKSITEERILEAVERHNMSLDNPGLCIHCGAENEGHEPDARRHKCEACGGNFVYGAEELMLRLISF